MRNDRFHQQWRTCVHGVVHNLLMQFFTLYNSKIKVSETYFFDIVSIQNDHASYVKHDLSSIYVLFTLLGYVVWYAGRGGGGSQWTIAQPAYIAFHPI